ncbi:MAG: Atxe2 family lasso peptide isopeptidase [Rhizomicrobium sp.]
MALAVILSAASMFSSVRPSHAADAAMDAANGLEVTVRDIIQVADLSGLSASADGRFAAVRVDRPDVATNSASATWHLISLDDVSRPITVDGGNPMWDTYGPNPTRAVWCGSSVYFRALHGEELAVWTADRNGRLRKVTHDDANVLSFRLDPGCTQLFYLAGSSRAEIKAAEHSEYANGVLITQNVNVASQLEGNLPYLGRMTTMRDSLAGERPLLNGKANTKCRVVDMADGKVRVPTSEEVSAYCPPPGSGYAPDNAIEPAAVSGDRRIVEFPLPNAHSAKALRLALRSVGSNRNIAICDKTECAFSDDVMLATQSVAWQPHSNNVLFVTETPGGSTTLQSWDTRSGNVHAIFQSPGLIGAEGGSDRFHAVGCAITARQALCTYAAAAEPPRLISIDLISGQWRTVLDPNQALRAKRFGSIRYLRWLDRWKRQQTGVLVLPQGKSDTTRPLVITSYRCAGFLRGGIGANVPEHVLARYGIASLCVNADKRYVEQPHPSGTIPRGQAANLQTALDAWESASDLLVAQKLIDPKRIGVSGLSFTGEAVQYALTHSTHFLVGGAGHGSFTDPFTYYFPSGAIGDYLHNLYGVPLPGPDSKAFYDLVSPALNASRMNSALLIQTDESEFRFSIEYLYRLRMLHKPVEMYAFADEGHQFWQPLHRLVRNTRFVDWFRFWLTGYVDPDPEKRAQFARWSALRTERARANFSIEH